MQKKIRLVKAEQKRQLEQIRKLYREAFPAAERKPFALMRQKCREGVTEMLSIEDENGAFLGLAITMLDGDLVLLDYFAIAPECREGGVGSAAFGLLIARYETKRFMLEIERTEAESIAESVAAEEPDEAKRRDAAEQMLKLRLRRKGFYLRNGMTLLPFWANVFGVDMEMLSYQCCIELSEYRGIYEHVYGRLAGKGILTEEEKRRKTPVKRTGKQRD